MVHKKKKVKLDYDKRAGGRAVRGGLIESMSKDWQQLRKCTIDISGGDPLAKGQCRGRRCLLISATEGRPAWLLGKKQVGGWSLEVQKCSCQADHLSF